MSKWCDTCYRNKLTSEWKSCDSSCPVFGKSFEELAKIVIEYRIKENKIYKTVEQECSGCGKHFYLKYCSDGNYEYIGEVCDCLATFHPVDGEPSFGEWIKQIKEFQNGGKQYGISKSNSNV